MFLAKITVKLDVNFFTTSNITKTFTTKTVNIAAPQI